MVISEIINQQAISRNIIILNAPESDGKNENNKSLINFILHYITPNFSPTVISRLSQKSNKSRSLKVTLHELSDVFMILKNKHKLRTFPS